MLVKLCIYVTFFVSLVSTAQISPAQKNHILSLISTDKKQSLEKIDYLISHYYVYNDLDSVDYYCNRLFLLSQEKKTNNYAGNISYYLGVKYAYLGQYKKAIVYLKNAITQHKAVSCQKCMAQDYNLLSLIYTKNQKPKDFSFAFKALKIFEQIKDTTGIIRTMENISMYYDERENYPMRDIYLKKLIRIFENHADSILASDRYKIYAYYYSDKNQDSTLYFLRQSLQYDRQINCLRCLTRDYFYLGQAYSLYGLDLDKSVTYYHQALDLSQKVFKPLAGSILTGLTHVYYEKKQYDKSIAFARRAYAVLQQERDWDTLEETSSLIFQSYYRLKKYDSAYEYVNRMMAFRDSLYLQQIERTSLELNTQYETEKKQLQIEKLQIKRKKDKQIKTLLTAGMSLLLIILLLLWRSFHLRRKKNLLEKELLQAEKEKTEQALQHKTRELTSQALMILQKNKLLKEILESLSIIKNTGNDTYKEIADLKRKLKRNMHSEKDWELFRQYFEQTNKNFFRELKQLNSKISSSELKLAALIKLGFSIKETASLLNISEGSVKTARYQLRKKLGLKRHENLFDFLNTIS